MKVHQDLLNIIIGKKSLLQEIESTKPGQMYNQELLGNLQACSQAVSDLTRLTVPHVPTCADDVKTQKKSCDQTIHELEGVLETVTTSDN